MNVLSTSHTLRHYTNANYQPQIADAGPYETWAEAGQQTADRRAAAQWQQMLQEYEQPQMQDSVRDALTEFVAERKASMPDEWH